MLFSDPFAKHAMEEENDQTKHKDLCSRCQGHGFDSMDVKEYPNSYVFIIDMPGLKSRDIKVKREEEEEGVNYIRLERRVGNFMRKFVLPENGNTDVISIVF
uniref:SHSP domain-containing protein n=1 Tax=Nelumbo nucifera TaxID=4432 RepID=A0A822ZCU1_NELNU|nr:TPA_asm: hypothetical protein HUJ06_000560 [Nelumbo nucifera]